jgi:hypothetical protein
VSNRGAKTNLAIWDSLGCDKQLALRSRKYPATPTKEYNPSDRTFSLIWSGPKASSKEVDEHLSSPQLRDVHDISLHCSVYV